MPEANSEALDLIMQMISWNPHNRPSCDECLRHPFFGKSHNREGHSKKESTDQYELLRYNEKTLKRIALNAQEESASDQIHSFKGGPIRYSTLNLRDSHPMLKAAGSQMAMNPNYY